MEDDEDFSEEMVDQQMDASSLVEERDSSCKPGQILFIHRAIPKNLLVIITSYLSAPQTVRLTVSCRNMLNKVQGSSLFYKQLSQAQLDKSILRQFEPIIKTKKPKVQLKTSLGLQNYFQIDSDNEDLENDQMICQQSVNVDSAVAEQKMFLVQSDLCRRANQIRNEIHRNILKMQEFVAKNEVTMGNQKQAVGDFAQEIFRTVFECKYRDYYGSSLKREKCPSEEEFGDRYFAEKMTYQTYTYCFPYWNDDQIVSEFNAFYTEM